MKLSSESRKVFDYCLIHNLRISCCESMSGGLLANQLVLNDGASKVVLGGIVAYDADIKVNIVGVNSQLIAEYGTVSRECCEALAINVSKLFNSDIGLSITGNAGFSPIENKKRGGYFVGCYVFDKFYWRYIERDGSRSEIIDYSVRDCLKLLLEILGI